MVLLVFGLWCLVWIVSVVGCLLVSPCVIVILWPFFVFQSVSVSGPVFWWRFHPEWVSFRVIVVVWVLFMLVFVSCVVFVVLVCRRVVRRLRFRGLVRASCL